MKKNQTQIKKYAAVISVFLAAVIVGLFIFFFCIKRSVEQRSKNMMRNNVVRQSEHLRTILDIQYDYLNGLAEPLLRKFFAFFLYSSTKLITHLWNFPFRVSASFSK